MNKYRVWLKDIALQDIEVAAPSEKEAKAMVERMIGDGSLFESLPPFAAALRKLRL